MSDPSLVDPFAPLRRLGDTPPASPEPVEALRTRVARRRRRQRRGRIGMASMAVATVVTLMVSSWGPRDANTLHTAGDPGATSSTSAGPGPNVVPEGAPSCAALDGTEFRVGDHVVVDVPADFAPDGGVRQTSTGDVDTGGERHAVLRLSDPQGRWIEVDSFNTGDTTAVIASLAAGAQTEESTYQHCVEVADGYERMTGSILVARHPDRTTLAVQEWEYGGVSVTGGPGVPIGELLEVAAGLRSAPPTG